MEIETVHLRLVPYSPDQLLALIEGDEHFEACFGLRAAEGLRAFLVSDEVSPAWLARLRASAASAADPWVHGFAVVHRESRSVIGSVGFKGPPDEDAVVELPLHNRWTTARAVGAKSASRTWEAWSST